MEKKESIASIFKKVFGEELVKHQFIYCGKLSAFIRVIDDEMIQYLGLEKLGNYDKSKKSFRIYIGNLSIYVDNITNKHLVMYGLDTYYLAYMKYNQKIDSRYIYDIDTLCEQMEKALSDAKKYSLPLLYECSDLKTYLSSFRTIGVQNLRYATEFLCDSLAMVIQDDHDDFLDSFNDVWSKKIYSPDVVDEQYELLYEGMVQSTAGERDKVYNDPELYAAALKECEIRKERNLQTLRELKVIK